MLMLTLIYALSVSVWDGAWHKISASADLKRYETPLEKYKKNAFRLSQQQFTLAGYRFWEMLNQILGSTPAVSETKTK